MFFSFVERRCSASANDGPTRTIKRKATPGRKTLRKKTRVPNTSKGDIAVRGVKRTIFDLNKHDMETASCSADTGRLWADLVKLLLGVYTSVGLLNMRIKTVVEEVLRSLT